MLHGDFSIEGIYASQMRLLFYLLPLTRLYFPFLPFFCQLGFAFTLLADSGTSVTALP